MEFKKYQKEALRSDRMGTRRSSGIDASLIVPLLGLAGETGQLLSEYKKHVRDGEGHELFKERVSEELGDLLWYIANVATKFDLDLDDIATDNLQKVNGRWVTQQSTPPSFDFQMPDGERLPRRFEVEIREVTTGNSNERRAVQIRVNDSLFGDDLTDNAYIADGYRFHDVFHFSYAAVLGWSPVTRSILRCKRKSHPLLDEVEDGGRAVVIEEGIVALVFEYARHHGMLARVRTIDSRLLSTIKEMTSHLEVKLRTAREWEQAILKGFSAWRDINENNGGRLLIDLDQRIIECIGD